MIKGVMRDDLSTFSAGFRAVLPLWVGMIPFGLAYAVTARSAGLSVLDTQLMSLLVFSGGAQFSAAGLFLVGAPALTIVLMTFLINVRHFLYSLTLGRTIPMSWRQRLLAAHFLTDEAFGIAIAARERRFPYLLGAELSVFVVWNLSTLAGSLLSQAAGEPSRLGIDFIFPLAFLALLIPLLTGWKEAVIALASGVLALLAGAVVGSGLAILLAGVCGALLGAWWTQDERSAAPASEPEVTL
jgi:4-azaleucine resistance transporter AzlC